MIRNVVAILWPTVRRTVCSPWFWVCVTFAVGAGLGAAWAIDAAHGPTWVKIAASLIVASAYLFLLNAVANSSHRLDAILAEARQASEALASLRDGSDDDAALQPTPAVFDNVPALLASRGVERRDDLLAKWRYRGTRRTGVKR